MENKAKLSCEFCHVAIHPNDGIKMVNGLPYHKHHTPDKTGKPVLNQAQLANLPAKKYATM